jgi:hypothetical protein
MLDTVRSIRRRSIMRVADRAAGLEPPITRVMSARTLGMAVGDMSKLPVLLNTRTLQNTSAEMVITVGYSAVGGTDVLG